MSKFLTKAQVAELKQRKSKLHNKVFNQLAVSLEVKRVKESGGVVTTQSNKSVRSSKKMSLYTVGGIKALHKSGMDVFEQQRRYAR